MRFMIMVKATAESESPGHPPDTAIADYHEALARAGILLDANRLLPSSQGWRVSSGAGGQRLVVDGPFAQPGALLAAYTMIQVRSRDEAMEWSRRFPLTHGEIEVRQVDEFEDVGPAGPDATTGALRAGHH